MTLVLIEDVHIFYIFNTCRAKQLFIEDRMKQNTLKRSQAFAFLYKETIGNKIN